MISHEIGRSIGAIAVLRFSGYIETFQFLAGWRTVRVSMISFSFLFLPCLQTSDREKSFLDQCQQLFGLSGYLTGYLMLCRKSL